MYTFLEVRLWRLRRKTYEATTFLTTITQYNSNNSLTPEFKLASFENRNNLDELIHIKTKAAAEERSMIQISFRTQDPNIRPAQSGIRVKNYT